MRYTLENGVSDQTPLTVLKALLIFWKRLNQITKIFPNLYGLSCIPQPKQPLSEGAHKISPSTQKAEADFCEFLASLVYIANSRTARTT